MAERSKAIDCKSIEFISTLVQIQPSLYFIKLMLIYEINSFDFFEDFEIDNSNISYFIKIIMIILSFLYNIDFLIVETKKILLIGVILLPFLTSTLLQLSQLNAEAKYKYALISSMISVLLSFYL